MTQPRLCIPVVPPGIPKALCLHIGISYTRFKLIGTILLCKRLFGASRIGLSLLIVLLNTFQIKHLSAYVPAEAGDRFLSMLPSWHAYERACEYFIFTCGVEQMYTSIRFLKVILILHFHTISIFAIIVRMSRFVGSLLMWCFSCFNILSMGRKYSEYSYHCAMKISTDEGFKYIIRRCSFWV